MAQRKCGLPSNSVSSLAMASWMRASRSSWSAMDASVHEMGYNDRVRWLGLALFLAACGQDESYFHAPDPGNLFKDPYDFSAQKYPRDLSAVVPEPDDMGGVIKDLGPDLNKSD